MSKSTDPNTRSARENIQSILMRNYGFRRRDFKVESIERNKALVTSDFIDERVLASCLRSSGLLVEHGEAYGLVVEA